MTHRGPFQPLPFCDYVIPRDYDSSPDKRRAELALVKVMTGQG